MVRLFGVELTPSGRPVLLPGEVERGMLDKIDVLFYGRGGVEEHPAEEYKDGYVVLTNYRLIWLVRDTAAGGSDVGGGVPCHVPLPAVSDVEHRGGMLVKAARLKLRVRLDGGRRPTADSRVVASLAPLKLVCRGPSPDTLYSQLQRALDSRAWAAAPPGLLQQLCPGGGPPPGPGGAAAAGRVAGGPLAAGLQAGAAAAAAAEPRFQPDRAIVEGLVAASFPRQQAVNAAAATRNAGVQQAVEWILDHQGSPLLDQPSPFLDAAGSGGGGGGGALPWAAAAAPGSGPQPSAAAPWPPPPHAGQPGSGSTFANPLLGGGGGGSGWGALGGGASSGSSWEALSGGGSGAAGSGQLAMGGGSTGSTGMQYGRVGGVGVAAILQQEERKAAATETAMDAAFADLDQLMRKAGEMVQLAQYFRERLGRPGGEGGEDELDAETALDLLNLGVLAPVTRESAGSLYHQELARQLSDFLRGPLERAAGMMPLPDAYCLYNRARGTELISPDDLLAAVKLFPKVRAPFTLREFSSGVKVIQAASHSDDAVCARLAEMAAPRPPTADAAADAPDAEAALLAGLGPALTRTEVAAALGVPVPVAGEHLKTAEARGVLCRDEGPQGLRFFRNFFADPALQAAAAS